MPGIFEKGMFKRTAQFIGLFVLLTATHLSRASSGTLVKPVRRVLIFYEVGLSYPAIELLDQQMRIALEASPFQLELYREYLETTLFPDPITQQQFRTWYIRKYRDRKPDVIIAVGESPLNFMVEVHEKAFPEVPIVFIASKDVAGNPRLDHHFTGVWENFEPEKTLEAAVRLLPRTRHVMVIGGTADFDRGLLALFRRKLSRYEDRFDFTYLTDFDMPTLIQRMKHLPENTVILYTHISQDAAGTRFVGASQSGPLVVSAANAPIFGPADVYLGRGQVGGYLESYAAIGKIVGETVIRILDGARPQDIPIVEGANVYMFDWRVLERWGINEKNLPPGSIVLNRQPTLWDSYKWYLVGGLCLLIAQTSLIVGLLWQRATRRKAEGKLKESEQRFRLVANTAPVMIWTTGTDKLCNYVNKPWLDFTGRTFEQELGSGWAESIHSEDVVNCLKKYTEAFDKREQFEMEYRVRRHDGEYRWVFDIGVARFNQDGSFAGYIGSCLDVTERKRAEEALSTIGRRLIEAHEEERTWIGRELHDDVNQQLGLLAVELDQWSKDKSQSNFTERFSQAQNRITAISNDVQALSHRLHSSKLEYLGLAAAAKSFCKEVSEKAKVEVQFSCSAVPSAIPKEASLCLFRVLQEALQNAIKYSGVRLFQVILQGTPNGLELTVSDCGIGFDEHDGFSRQGLGLISMRERLQMVNGALNIKTQPGRGTTISARVPLQTAELQAKAG
jgi:PAS domain S-box-containing protein